MRCSRRICSLHEEEDAKESSHLAALGGQPSRACETKAPDQDHEEDVDDLPNARRHQPDDRVPQLLAAFIVCC